jgi:uncharacterized protein YfaT (DUF1175 family)
LHIVIQNEIIRSNRHLGIVRFFINDLINEIKDSGVLIAVSPEMDSAFAIGREFMIWTADSDLSMMQRILWMNVIVNGTVFIRQCARETSSFCSCSWLALSSQSRRSTGKPWITFASRLTSSVR